MDKIIEAKFTEIKIGDEDLSTGRGVQLEVVGPLRSAENKRIVRYYHLVIQGDDGRRWIAFLDNENLRALGNAIEGVRHRLRGDVGVGLVQLGLQDIGGNVGRELGLEFDGVLRHPDRASYGLYFRGMSTDFACAIEVDETAAAAFSIDVLADGMLIDIAQFHDDWQKEQEKEDG